MSTSEIDDAVDKFGFCDCGEPAEVLRYIASMLSRLDRQEWCPYTDMPYMFFCYWANREAYAEHGSTVRCSWLTLRGKGLLEEITVALEGNEKLCGWKEGIECDEVDPPEISDEDRR